MVSSSLGLEVKTLTISHKTFIMIQEWQGGRQLHQWSYQQEHMQMLCLQKRRERSKSKQDWRKHKMKLEDDKRLKIRWIEEPLSLLMVDLIWRLKLISLLKM